MSEKILYGSYFGGRLVYKIGGHLSDANILFILTTK